MLQRGIISFILFSRMGAVAGQQVIRSTVYILQWTPQSLEAMKI